MNTTLYFYEKNAEQFAENTQRVDFRDVQERFLQKLPPGAKILDFGCGAGRDTKYFLARGFDVAAADGSEEMCRIAGAYTGIAVKRMLFQELDEREVYDGIWACSSILHLPKAELGDVLERMERAVKTGGIIYASFKYGTFEGMRGGRYFTDFTAEIFADFMKDYANLCIEECWITGDARPGRSGERWLNLILCKGTERDG